jgi:predicted ATP-dependent endonuclease of OLD family
MLGTTYVFLGPRVTFTGDRSYNLSHLKHFSVSGLAGRQEIFSRDLDRHENVFFGLNGSGKTSLLKIFDSAMSGDASGLLSVPFNSAEVTIYSETYQIDIVRELNKVDLIQAIRGAETPGPTSQARSYRSPNRESARIEVWQTKTALPKDASNRWSHVFLPLSRMYATLSSLRVREGTDEEQINDYFEETVRTVWRSYFSTVLSQVRQAQTLGLTNILKDVLAPEERDGLSETLDENLAYTKLQSFLARQGALSVLPGEAEFKSRYRADRQLRTIVSDVDDVENRITAAMAPRRHLQELVGRLFSGGKSASFTDDNVGIRIGESVSLPLGLLSSGEKQVLRLLIECLRVQENTLLIDEPELSLHVDWQRGLISAMRALNPDCQLILATHSPEIMAEVADERIFRL